MSWFKALRMGGQPNQTGAQNSESPRAPVLDAPGPGLFAYGRQRLTPLTRFEDIPVVPVSQETGMVLLGGPVWENWPQSGALRHNRSGIPVDRKPPVPGGGLTDFTAPATWGGHAVPHFGHFIVEHSTRILQARVEHGAKKMLFTLPPGHTADQIPAFFWQILAWYGVETGNVSFVTAPLRVRELWAAPMAEQWAHVPTSEDYLSLLSENSAARGLKTKRNAIVYVARDRMEATAEGHNAGEPYLVSVLQRLGVTVIRPETLSLRDQLAYYQGAETLIFAEGSALHGLQLLGRRDQTVVVLNRRPNMRIGLSAIQPRVTTLAYAEVTRGTAAVLWPNGNPWIVRAISLYDVDCLPATFGRLGVPLSRVWDNAAYLAARDHGIRTWIRLRFDPRVTIDHPASARRVRQEFTALGLTEFLDELPPG
tara:strand:+ start:4717 stop:5988 length:1272 start_codon:yes stop_codon:yes gene_type:complete